MILTSPTVELLRKALPDAHLAMMVGPWSAEIASRDPLIDELLLCSFPGFTRRPNSSPLAPYRLLWQTALRLRARGFDAALVLRFDHWWGAGLAALAGVPWRIGYGVRECAPFLTHALDPGQRGHWVEQSIEIASLLLDTWGAGKEERGLRLPLRFGLSADDERQGATLLEGLPADVHGPLVAFHPGSGSPLKLWPEDRWTGLGRALAAAGARVVVTGTAAEMDVAERIARGVPEGRSLANLTTPGTLAALYRHCATVVGVDSGPLHLAVAMGTPTVHLFGPTDPAVYGPWGDPSRHRVVASPWPGAPCGRLDVRPPDGGVPPCMDAITLERVLEECRGVLGVGG